MTSVGIMASSVVVSAGTDVLLENFTDVSEWTGVITSVAGGRTGNAGRVAGNNSGIYTVPAINESASLTVGFAYKIDSLATFRPFLFLQSDAGVTIHETVQANVDGSLSVRLGGTGGTVYGTTAAGLVAVNTYAYIEVGITLHDTAGAVIVKVNGVTALNLSNVDTKAAGTKAVFESIALRGGGTGTVALFDDLYLTMGAAAAFKGSITVP